MINFAKNKNSTQLRKTTHLFIWREQDNESFILDWTRSCSIPKVTNKLPWKISIILGVAEHAYLYQIKKKTSFSPLPLLTSFILSLSLGISYLQKNWWHPLIYSGDIIDQGIGDIIDHFDDIVWIFVNKQMNFWNDLDDPKMTF